MWHGGSDVDAAHAMSAGHEFATDRSPSLKRAFSDCDEAAGEMELMLKMQVPRARGCGRGPPSRCRGPVAWMALPDDFAEVDAAG